MLDEKTKKRLLKKIQRHAITKAELLKAVLALRPVCRVTGKIGKWIIRWQNDRPIISRQAEVYHASQSAGCVAARNSMQSAINLAIALNKIKPLKEVWSYAKADGQNSYTKLIKHAKKNLEGSLPSGNFSITPEKNQFDITECVVYDSKGSITVHQHAASSDILILVMIACNPVLEGTRNFEVIKIYDSPVQDAFINLSEEQLQVCSNYQNYLLLSAVIRKNENGLTWSNTVVTQGEFAFETEKNDSSRIYFIFPIMLPESYFNSFRLRKDHPPPGFC